MFNKLFSSPAFLLTLIFLLVANSTRASRFVRQLIRKKNRKGKNQMNWFNSKQLKIILSIFGLLFLSGQARAQVMTGGSFQLMQTVIANGGEKSSGGTFSVEGTIAQQTVVEQNHINNPFSINSGFWSAQSAPAATGVVVSGRVINNRRRGEANVLVELSGGPSGTPQTTLTNTRGFFQFNNVEVGYSYIITVQRVNSAFAPSSETFHLQNNLDNLLFHLQP